MSKLKEWMTWPIAAVVIVGGLIFGAIVIFAPADARTELIGANGLLWTLVASYLRSPRETVSVKAGPLVMLLAASLTLGMASGCGSAIQTQAHAVTVAAVATQGAARMSADASRLEARAACPTSTYAPNSLEMTACLAPIRARWAPAEAAIGVTKATLSTWIEAVDLARIAGDGDDLWEPLALAASRLVADWEALRLVLAPLGVDLPAMPAIVTAAATALGGGS